MENKTPVCGIISIVCSIVSFFVFWWLSIIGIILGAIGMGVDENKTFSKIGLIIGIVALAVYIISVIIAAAAVTSLIL